MSKKKIPKQSSGIEAALVLILEEVRCAQQLYPPYVNVHHAYAVMLEQLDEFWDMLKYTKRKSLMRLRIAQVAAACLRYLANE